MFFFPNKCTVYRCLSFLEEIKHFDSNIRQLYTKSSYLVDDESWPPFTPNKFISLLLIRHLEKCAGEYLPTLASNTKTCNLKINSEQSFTTNDISEIFQHGEKVEAHNKIILIIGVPGIGKTILSKEIAYQWADDKLLSKKEIVLMLFLRDPAIQKITELKHLVHYFYGFSEDTCTLKFSTVCSNYLFQSGGSNVTIILDGLDEIPTEVIDNTYIKLLLDRKALPCCRIVVTSRPAISIRFQSKVDIEAEILGFTEENVNRFIQNELKEDKQKKLIYYFKQNKNLYHLCYIPFILSVLVCIAKEYDDLPSNRVEVYKKFVIFTISRFLKRFEQSSLNVFTIDELPVEYKSYLLELAKYAFNALEIDQVVFTRKDIIKDFPILASAPETWYGLGLLNTVKYFKISESSDCVSYNFLHKSIQEYLAALYVTTLNEAKQFDIIKRYFFHEKYLNMWIMYIGLSKDLFSFWHFLSGNKLQIWSKLFGITGISTKILYSKIHCFYLFHCFSELRYVSMCNLVGTLFQFGKFDLSNCTLSLNEISMIMFILERSTTTYWGELNLSHCNIGDTGCQYLCKGLSTLNRKVYFDEIDIDNNMLSLESVQHLVSLLVQCKTQKLYATSNDITMDNANIAYLVMKYAFAVKALTNPLSIIVNRQERAIFCQSENKTIIKYLKIRYMVCGLYCINCQLNDEVIELITDLIMKHGMITDLYFWNSNISEDYCKKIMSIMPQENRNQFVFVYEAIQDGNYIVAIMLPAYISFAFIYLSKLSLILCNATYLHINHLIFANPMLPETTLMETVCLSHCELSDETTKLLIQLLNQCNNISVILLLNNTFSSNNLNQLMHTIISKYCLKKIIVYQNNMTTHDINLLINVFQKFQILLINDKVLIGCNCCDEQLKYASEISPPLIILRLLYCYIEDHTLPSVYKLFQNYEHLREITICYCLINVPTNNKLLQHISTITTLRKLNVRGNKLTEENSPALMSVITNNTELEELYLSNNQLQSAVIELAKALQKISSLKVLDLNYNNIPEQAADELSAAIRVNNSLQELCLGSNHLGSSTVMIVNALKEITTLKELNLNDNQNRSVELAPAIASIITKNKLIERLSLNDNNLNDDGVIRIAQSLCKHSQLKSLTLQNNNITEEAVEALASIISSNIGLEELYLGNNQLQLGVTKIATTLKNISSLKVLDLDNNNIPEQAADDLAAVIMANSVLEKLWLSGNHLGSSTVMIVNALKKITTLKELNLNDNQNRSDELAPAIASIITKNKLIEKLLLNDNNLNDDGVIRIAQSLCKHSQLKSLTLQNNNITEEAVEALASIISSNIGLEELYLGNNQLQLGVTKIATTLKNISSLKVLELHNNNIPEQAANDLAAVIMANSLLEKLWLSGNHLGSSTVIIVNALKEITTLKVLSLDGNQNRSDELAPAITSIITKNKLIEKLLLSDNNLNDDGVIRIAQSLCKHCKLKSLKLQSNNITEEAAEALASIISSNIGLEELYLGNNQLQLGVTKIATTLKNISSLKVLDLHNNNIPEQAANDLAAVIMANSVLEMLWLGGNHLGSSTVIIINALKEITTLKVLSLDGNQNRSDELSPAIISIITKNKLIEKLLLSDNNLNDDGVIRIAQSLCKHCKLKSLDLQSNNITEEAAEALASIISSNIGLEELYLGNNQLQLGVTKIATTLKNISSLKVLDLHNNNIPEQAANDLAAVIMANSVLEMLWLGGNHLGSSTVIIVNALKEITTLKVLSLDGNQNRSDELSPAIISIITKNKLIEKLLLSDNNLNDDGVIRIAQSLCKHCKLKSLDLQSNNITEEAAEALASIISSNIGLKELYLGNNQLQLGVTKIATTLKNISSLKVLDLDNNNIPEQAANDLAAVIMANSVLEKLRLSGNHLGSSSTVMIVNALKKITTLKELDLNGNQNRSDELAPAIASIITKIILIERLSLHDNNLNDGGVIRIARSLCNHSKLKMFNLQNNNITEEAAASLASIISSNIGLEELYLGNNQLQLGVTKIATTLKNISSLKVLDLQNNNIPEQAANDLAAAIMANSLLEILWLSGNHLGSSTVIIVNALKEITTLKVLNLNSNQNRSDELAPAIASIITKNKLIEKLLLSDNNLNDDGVIRIAQSLCKHSQLKSLDLQNNNITEEAVEALASIISSNIGLEELYLGNNQLQLGVTKIATTLKNISSLKVLNLDNNNIPEQAANDLAAVIMANSVLEKLWLSGNHLGSSTVMIVNALKKITTLKELNLNDNQNRSDELAPAIASIITKNKLIEKLLLNDNNLNDDGVIRIAQSLCKHSQLKSLTLQNNNITEEAVEALASIISSNTGLEELYLGNNQLQLGVTKISTTLKNISSLKVLELHNNNIPEQAANDLAAAIMANSLLEKLWLSGNHLGSSTVMIVNALKEITTLKVLSLDGNQNRSDELAPAIASIITKNKLIERLLLSDNNLNDDGVIRIAQSLYKHSKLKSLSLRNNNITKKAAEALTSIISSNIGLEELYLSNNQLQLGVTKIATTLKNISSLKVLDLDNNNIPEQAANDLAAVIMANSVLEKLRLSGNHLGSSSTVMIVNALKKITTLKELDLNGNQNRSDELAPAIASIITKNILIERLSLHDNNLNDGGVIRIARSLCNHSKLKMFNLQNNNITEEAAEALASIISSNIGLEELYLGNNQLQLGVTKIATTLKNISSLKVLDLQNNNIPEQAANDLAAAIMANSLLEILWLGGNHLGSSTVIIVNALKEITTLKVLNLNGNQNRSDELAPAIASIITKNKLIEKLLLSDNNLNDDGVIRIAQSLCKHSQLKSLDLQNNNITEEAAEALASIISSNIGLEELYLGNNQLQLGVTKIATTLKNISSLKVLDLQNNNIPEEGTDELSAAIRANNLIEKIWLNDNNLGSSIAYIARACCHNSSLKEFYFKNTGISVAVTDDISAAIKCNTLLEGLSMSDNNLQSSGFMVIVQALQVKSSLKFLYAYGINITSTVSEELSSVIDHNRSLKELSLSNNYLENGLIQIAESCSGLANLKLLELSHNCISPTQVVKLASIVSKCNSLEALSLGGICFSVDESLYLNVCRIRNQLPEQLSNSSTQGMLLDKCLYELLRMKKCQLSSLHYDRLSWIYQYWYVYISYQHKDKFNQWSNTDYDLITQEAKQKLSQIDSKVMMSSLQIIGTLKVINLENNNINEDAATELAGHLRFNNTLEQLWLRGNELYDKGASVVLQSLHNLSTLLILDLSFNHLSSESADGIAVVIGNNCSLQQLWLDGNDLLTRGVVIIASALKKLSSLRILSLGSNGITDDAAEEISNVITSNVLLVDLLLGNNQLKAMGVCKIALAIRKLLILRKLDLSNNHITPDATEELAVTLANCTNLQELFLNDNMLGTEGTIKIANALKCINSLQVLTLSDNNINESAADAIVDVLKNNISLKIVLIGKNDLQTIGVNLIVQTAKNITTLQLLDISDNNVSQDEKEMIFANYNNFIVVV